MYLFLNNGTKEKNWMYSFFNYGMIEGKQMYSTLNYLWFDIAIHSFSFISYKKVCVIKHNVSYTDADML
jgi:hypothetical protein